VAAAVESVVTSAKDLNVTVADSLAKLTADVSVEAAADAVKQLSEQLDAVDTEEISTKATDMYKNTQNTQNTIKDVVTSNQAATKIPGYTEYAAAADAAAVKAAAVEEAITNLNTAQADYTKALETYTADPSATNVDALKATATGLAAQKQIVAEKTQELQAAAQDADSKAATITTKILAIQAIMPVGAPTSLPASLPTSFTSPTPPPTADSAPTADDPTADPKAGAVTGNDDSSSSSGGSSTGIIIAVVIVVIVIAVAVVVVVVMKKKGGGGGGGSGEGGERAVVSFENPMYDQAPKDGKAPGGSAPAAEGMYAEPAATDGYQDVSPNAGGEFGGFDDGAAGSSGYMDVGGGGGGGSSGYMDVSGQQQSGYMDVGGGDDDDGEDV
jgi:hypothetical protein